MPSSVHRIKLVSQALEHSGLTDATHVDFYHQQLTDTAVDVQKAAAEAFRYLAAESHPAVPNSVMADSSDLGPHITAMANMLRGYAAASGRPYTGRQKLSWKLMLQALLDTFLLTDGQIRTGPRARDIAAVYRQALEERLIHSDIDVYEGRFLDDFADMDSPSGDLDLLLAYIVFQGGKTFERRQDVIEDRKERLSAERRALLATASVIWAGRCLAGC